MVLDHNDQFGPEDRPLEHYNGPPSPLTMPEGSNRRSLLAWLGILLAWVVILAILVLRFAAEPASEASASSDGSDQSTGSTQPAAEAEEESPMLVLDLRSRVTTVLQCRYLVGASELLPDFKAQALEEASVGLKSGSIGNRLGYVTVIGAVGSSDEAEHALDDLEQEVHRSGYTPTAQESEVLQTLAQVYSSSAGPLTQQQQDMLIDQLGWCGRLALATGKNASIPSTQVAQTLGQAQKTILIAAAVGMLGLAGCFLGLIGLILILVFLCTGRIRSGFSLAEANTRFSGVSVETFSVWLVWFIFLQWLAGVIAEAAAASAIGALLLSSAAFVMSIDALIGWPFLRGFRWRAICQQSGLHTGRSFWMEVMWGIAGYVMALPIVVVGLVLTLVLMQLSTMGSSVDSPGNAFQPIDEPLHPINMLMIDADIWTYLAILLVGSVCAPVVEEFAFRGMFYRHLRGATRRWNIGLSIVLSTLITAFIFAAIHPQGWVAIPVLMSLAIAFALLREWRGSLVAPMVAHALSNFLILTFGILLFS